jgi:ABC-type antimicrobial peptide transport system permease subunit
MQKKIINHYGTEVKECVSGLTKHNWEDVLKCMVTVLGISNPKVWIAEQLVIFAKWSAECSL